MAIRETVIAVLVVIFAVSAFFLPEIIDYLLVKQDVSPNLMASGTIIWLIGGVSLIAFWVFSASRKKSNLPKSS